MGVSSRSVVRRLRAWHLGEPLTRGVTIHHHIADERDRLLLAFVKMGGETRPWGMAWKEGRKKIQVRSVPEPRNRAAVDEMVSEFAEVLARHLRHPSIEASTDADGLRPLRQIWLPNPAHVDMLHHFGYAYARRRLDSPLAEPLRLLGRTSLFAFLEAQRPSQQLVMIGTEALRSAYDFPAEDVRQGHLGFLLAWLQKRGDRERGLNAALQAEKLPTSPALAPTLERDQLSKLVEAHNEANRSGTKKVANAIAREIAALLAPELQRRLELVQDAIEMIETDPRPYNPGVEKLVDETVTSQYYRYNFDEAKAIASGTEPFVPSAESDFQARGAAARYFRHQAGADRLADELVHYDHELEAEAISQGNAFRGTIISVHDEGVGNKTVPVWVVEDPSPGPLRIRTGDAVCVVGHSSRSGRARRVEPSKGGGIQIEFEITKIVKADAKQSFPNSMHSTDDRWVGKIVTLIGTSFARMTDRKAQLASDRKPKPGDWLLDASPAALIAEHTDLERHNADGVA